MCPAVPLETLPWLWAGSLKNCHRNKCRVLLINLEALLDTLFEKSRKEWSFQILPGFASFLWFMLAFEGMMNLSRKVARGSAASRDAAYSLVRAFSGNAGLEVMEWMVILRECVLEISRICLSSGFARWRKPDFISRRIGDIRIQPPFMGPGSFRLDFRVERRGDRGK